MNINYCFIRHSQSYLNAIVDDKTLSNKESSLLFKKLSDPLLSPSGRYASKKNGLVIEKVLNENHSIKKGIVLGCSVLLRSMLTAFLISRKWTNPPKTIFVFPYLREIDESSDDKFSVKSQNTTNSNSGYCMRSLVEQRQILDSIGILKFFDFSFVENTLRKETGDIKKFIHWSKTKFLDNSSVFKNLNFIVITHAGVLRDYAKTGFYNNTGIIVKTTFVPISKTIIIHSFYNLTKDLFVNPDFIHSFKSSKFIKFNEEEFQIILKNINTFLDEGYKIENIPIKNVYNDIKWFKSLSLTNEENKKQQPELDQLSNYFTSLNLIKN